MKTIAVALLAATTMACLAVGCGVGGAAPHPDLTPVSDSATLKAIVVENDGATTGLDGHAFTVAQTGETALTSADGSLDFGPVPLGSLTLRLVSTYALRIGSEQGDDDGGHAADDVDDEHASPTEVRVERVQARERIEIRMHLMDGEMHCVRVSRQLRNEQDVEIRMERTDANEDPDMTGELELERDMYRQTFGVLVAHADAGRELELVVVDLDGDEESQGTRVVDAFGQAEWKTDTGAGDRLPFAVTDLEALEGYDVSVRDADTGDVLLTATVSEMPPAAGDGSGVGDGDGGGDRLHGRALLTAVELDLAGYVEIRSRNDGACESFQIEAEGLSTGRTVEFLVEDPSAAGSFLGLDTRTAHGAKGKAHLGLSTEHGDVLPGGVGEVADLVGLGVEVRDAETGDLLLFGAIPEMVAD